MVEVAAAAAASSFCRLPLVHGGGRNRSGANFTTTVTWKTKRNLTPKEDSILHYYSHSLPTPRSSSSAAAASRASTDSSPPDTVTFSSSTSSDTPLFEPPGVSFDEYICDRARVFRAMFPDARRSKRLNDEEWKIQMFPIQFLLASVNPVVVMRLRHKRKGEDYPPGVPAHASSVLDLQATRWELQGLQAMQIPPHFVLTVQGVLYPDRSHGYQMRLKGHLEMGMSMILPPVLKLVPADVLRSIAEAVLRRLLEKMKHEVDAGLISDYNKFRREKLLKQSSSA